MSARLSFSPRCCRAVAENAINHAKKRLVFIYHEATSILLGSKNVLNLVYFWIFQRYPVCAHPPSHTNGIPPWAHRPFCYSTKEPGSSDIFIQIYTRGSKEWRYSFDRSCAHSKILQIVMKYRSIHIRFQNS